MAIWYLNYGDGSTTGYYAVAQWAALTTLSVGAIRRQLATPSVGNERCFRVSSITTGITGSSEPAWTLTKGGTTTDSGVTWTECTGNSSQNWNAPLARSAQAHAWAAAGDDIAIASISQETQASAMTFTPAGTPTNLVRMICVNAAGSVPPTGADETTGATISMTANASVTLCSGGGSAYYQGIEFKISSGSGGGGLFISPSGNNQNVVTKMKNCKITFVGTSATNVLNGNTSGWGSTNRIELENTPISFSATGQSIVPTQTEFIWTDTPSALPGAAQPTNLFTFNNPTLNILIDDVDMGTFTGTIFPAGGGNSKQVLKRGKINASATFKSRPTHIGDRAFLINADSGATGYKQSIVDIAGTLTAETTLVRSGGASDGVTPISHKVVTTANVSRVLPFRGEPMIKWCAAGSPITISVAIMNDGTTLTNAEFWLEARVMDSSGSPLGAPYSSAPAGIYTTPTNVPTDGTSSWTTTGISSPVLQVASVTFTPQIAGDIEVTPCFARASKTVYMDPSF